MAPLQVVGQDGSFLHLKSGQGAGGVWFSCDWHDGGADCTFAGDPGLKGNLKICLYLV